MDAKGTDTLAQRLSEIYHPLELKSFQMLLGLQHRTQGFCNRFWYSSVPILPAAPFHEHIVRYVLATQSALLCYPGLFHPRTAKSDMFLTIA